MNFIRNGKIESDEDIIIYEANRFYAKTLSDRNGRFHSWENCYKAFYEVRGKTDLDYDYLCLQLGFYLASWGMLRDSFLLEKSHTVHMKAVREILDKKYDSLLDIKCFDYDDKNIDLLFALKAILAELYKPERESVKKSVKSDISDILLSKILMGTLGCVPAYDNSFKKAARNTKLASSVFNKNSIKSLRDYYVKNSVIFDSLRENMTIQNGLCYPQMKFLDMAFWNLGCDLKDGNITVIK